MDTPIQICKEFLESEYAKTLILEFGGFESKTKIVEKQPVWQWIDRDLNPLLEVKATNAESGLLLDPEIGICLYILHLDPVKSDIAGQIIRGLEIRSKLLPVLHEGSGGDNTLDRNGSWRVVMNWLIDDEEVFSKHWLPIIIKMRMETAHFEEIPVDAIVNSKGDWRETIREYGFARLLLQTRSILRKNSPNEIAQWMSADELVLGEVKNMPFEFEKPELVKLSQRVVSQIESYQQEPNSDNRINIAESGTYPRNLQSVRVRDFRNIENLELQFGPELVKPLILHGPNGTGKSALFEAICFGLSQTSNRYCDFLKDKDISGKDLARQYVETFIQPMRSAQDTEPEVWINEEKVPISPISDEDEANHMNMQMSGTLLSQEITREFLTMSSDQLGATVLTEYSDLAERLESYVNKNYRSAETSRQDFLESLGLTKGIKLIKTARERIVAKIIQSDLPAISHPLLDWLELAGNIDLPNYKEAGRLSAAWKAWSDEAKKARLVKEISSLTEVEAIQDILLVWLEQYNQLVIETNQWTESLSKDDLKPLQREAEFFVDRLNLWGEWLSKQSTSLDGESADEVEQLRKEIEQLNRKQQEIIREGKEQKARLDHFAQIERYVREDWSKKHPNECPTCGSDLEERGGILKVFKDLQSKVEEEREEHTGRYRDITSSIKDMEMKLVSLGQQECPVSVEDQARLMQSLQWLVPNGQLLSEYISERDKYMRLIQQIQTLRQFPSIPNKIDIDVESERVAEKVVEEFRRAVTIFEDPDNWKVIKNKLDERLSSVVERHLPDTLGRLWIELTMNLTSAPWLLPERPKFQVRSLRGERHLTVRLGEEKEAPLARYILNQAEVHILGLAWFFARYLTLGRFNHSCIIMDDPAQEMDQITYRDLCRFLETIVRLHGFDGKPLTLLMMLNQEGRALDAARATGGMLTILGLNDYQRSDTIERRNILGQGFYPFVPGLNILHVNE